MKNRIIYILLLAATLYSCRTTANTPEKTEEIPELPAKDTGIEQIKEPTEFEIVEDIINSMTLEEKIGQLFIFQIRNNSNGNPLKKVDKNLISFLTKYKPGGIILFSHNVDNNEQVIQLVDDLQKVSDIPLFIGVDEEGGLVSRLGKEPDVDVTHLPPALKVGNKNNPELALNSGLILGRELSSLGINMDMAPVADVNTNPSNPVIGNRTYSSDPETAGIMVSNVIEGLHRHNVISIIKHFPGHGDTSLDTHEGTVISPHSRERLEEIEFVPFRYGIDAGVDAIMTAHIVMSGVSDSTLPATLNHEIITGIIRDDLGFDGIIITDALDMGAISKNYGSDETAILGIKAGIDILLIPNNQPKAYNALLNSVINEDISIERIEESLRRILLLKHRRGILQGNTKKESITDVISDPYHIELKKTVLE